MTRGADRVAALLAAVRQTRPGYALAAKLPGGMGGAWLLAGAAGSKLVLKCAWDEDRRERLAAAARVVDLLASRGAPVPRYLAVEYEAELGTWSLQEHLPGEPVEELTQGLVAAVIEVNRMQAGLASEVEGARDRSAEVARRLRDERFAADALELLEEYGDVALPSDDVVHGDLVATQLLCEGGRLTGVVDWDSAGRGDRCHDLALLFYNVFAQADRLERPPDESVVAALGRAGLEAGGAERFGAFLAYEALDALRFVGERSPAHVRWRADLARRSVDAYRALLHSIE